MFPDAATLNSWAAGWSTHMIALLWQSVLLAGAVGLVASLLPRATPAMRYWLWQIVAAKLLLMPIWSVSLALAWLPATADVNRQTQIALPATETSPSEPHVVSATSAPARPTASNVSAANRPSAPASVWHPLSWTVWLMLAWAMIVVGQLGLLLRQLARLGRLLKQAKPAGIALESLVRDCAARVTLTRIPRVLVADEECSPFVCGVWRPTVVLPRSLEPLLSDGQLEPVIVHELAHVKRLDLLWNWIPQITRMLYFFNPVAHWVAFRVRLEGELACDGWAMAATGKAPSDYADLLARIVGRLSEPAMLRSGSAASVGLDGQAGVHGND